MAWSFDCLRASSDTPPHEGFPAARLLLDSPPDQTLEQQGKTHARS